MKDQTPLKVVYRQVVDLIPYARNARTHSDEQVTRIASSIKEFGFTNPILIDGDNGIIAGHGRLMAAKKLGMREVPTIELSGMTDAQKRAYILADNKLALDAGWDEELLRLEFEELRGRVIDLELTGFSLDEINDILGQDDLSTNVEEQELPEPPTDPVTKLGDVWILGRHRLVCGDCTDKGCVESCLHGDSIDMVFTDPPYNIAYKGVNDDRTIKNDKMPDEDFVEFLKRSLLYCKTAYVCCSWQYSHLFRRAMEEVGMPPKAMIVWNKVFAAQHLDKYFKQHEIIFYHGKFGGETTLRGDIWECKRQRNTLHPTMKPIELIQMALEDNPSAKVVFDGFGGSGSTLIACESTGKSARLIELEPSYCDVIIKRWQDCTGQKAHRESDGVAFDDLAN